MGGLRKLTMWIALVAVIVPLAGCRANANRFTVARTTEFPPPDTKRGIAVHLDAQQRVVLSNAKGFCAEPSPDAFSAYVASIGLKAGKPDDDSLSFANSLASISSNLGLRTQSITLMRDALYRICEASNNDSIQAWETAALLRRSQDLTAVILAIEQLTGAVMAKQVTLSPHIIEADRAIHERVNAAKLRRSTDEVDVSESAGVKHIDASEAAQTKQSAPATQGGTLDPEAVKAIAASVEAMVVEVLGKNYEKELCIAYLAAVTGANQSPAVGICESYLKETLLQAFFGTESTSSMSFFPSPGREEPLEELGEEMDIPRGTE